MMGMLIKCIYAVIKFNNGEIVNRLLSGDSSKLNINFEEVGGFKFGRRMLEKKPTLCMRMELFIILMYKTIFI